MLKTMCHASVFSNCARVCGHCNTIQSRAANLCHPCLLGTETEELADLVRYTVVIKTSRVISTTSLCAIAVAV